MAEKGKNWKSLKVGIVFTFGIALIAALGLIISKNSAILAGFRNYKIFVEDAEGLAESNFVSISGKKVGTVRTLSLAEKDGKNGIEIEVRIEDRFSNIITTTSVSSIKAIGILGDKYIDIKLGKEKGEVLKDGDFLTYKREAGMAELTESANNIMKNLADILEKVNKGEGVIGKIVSSDDLTKRIVNIVENVDKVTNATAEGKGMVGKLFNDEQLALSFVNTTKNLQAITDNLKSGEGTVGKLLKDQKLYDDLSASIAKLNSIIDKVDKGEGSIGKILKERELYDNINKATVSLDSLLKDLKKNPSRYINVKVF